jgi:hypothetical protein
VAPVTLNFARVCTFEIRNINPLYDFTTYKIHFSYFLPEHTEGHLISFRPVRKLNARDVIFAFLLLEHPEDHKNTAPATRYFTTQRGSLKLSRIQDRETMQSKEEWLVAQNNEA